MGKLNPGSCLGGLSLGLLSAAVIAGYFGGYERQTEARAVTFEPAYAAIEIQEPQFAMDGTLTPAPARFSAVPTAPVAMSTFQAVEAAPAPVAQAPAAASPVESDAVRDRKTLHVTTMDNCVHCEAFANEAAAELEAAGWIIEYQPVSTGAPTFSYQGHVRHGYVGGKPSLFSWLRSVTGQQTPSSSPMVVTRYSDPVPYSSCSGSDWAEPVEGYDRAYQARPQTAYYHYQAPAQKTYQRSGFQVFGWGSGGCASGMCR